MTLSKLIRHTLLWLALGLLTACQTVGVPAPQSFGDRIAAAYVACSAARDTALILGRAGKITLGDATNVQQQADNLRAGIDIARGMHAAQPGAADDRLSAAMTALTALDTYLQSRTR